MTAINPPAAMEDFRRDALPRVADGLAAAVAASLPWSTSATGILTALWLLAMLPTLSMEVLRRDVLSPAGGLPVLLTLWAVVGMAWADVPMNVRLHGLESFLRLLMIPVLFIQFRRSDRGLWVGAAFLVSATLLLAASYFMIIFADRISLGLNRGVPVKDYISQSGIFTLCAFALLHVAILQWEERRRMASAICGGLAVLFVANMIYVVTSRTALVVMPALYLLLALQHGFRQRSFMVLGGYALVGAAAVGVVWATSSNLQLRVTTVSKEISEHREVGADTSSGARLEFWQSSLRSVSEAPVLGHGTGSIAEEFRRHSSEPAAATGTNPHNQILTVAMQLGAVGVVILLAMWATHWLMFLSFGLPAWIGLMVVTQNIISSQFNSHLMDFTQGWLYVFGVGVFGGMELRRKAGPPPAVLSPAPPPAS